MPERPRRGRTTGTVVRLPTLERSRTCHVSAAMQADGAHSSAWCEQGIRKDEGGQVTELTGDLHLEGSVKATKLKLTWLPQVFPMHLSAHSRSYHHLCGDESYLPSDLASTSCLG